MRTRRPWRRSGWTRPTGNERLQLAALREFLTEQLDANPDAKSVNIPTDQVRGLLDLTRPGAGSRGAEVTDDERGVVYRVVLDTSKADEPRLRSVEVVRQVIGDGLSGWTAKGGIVRRKGKPGTFLAPYDEGVFRLPVHELIAQTLAALEWEDGHRDEDGRPGIVIGARRLAAPTPGQLRQHLRDGLSVQQIADRYERKPRMVYGWLAAARASAPELDWPEVKHGPVPTKIPDAAPASGHERKAK